MVIDIVDALGYVEYHMNPTDFKKYIKNYVGEVTRYLDETNPARVPVFRNAVQDLVTRILKNFKDFTFFMPKNHDIAHFIIIAECKGVDSAPTLIYLMDGLTQEVKK